MAACRPPTTTARTPLRRPLEPSSQPPPASDGAAHRRARPAHGGRAGRQARRDGHADARPRGEGRRQRLRARASRVAGAGAGNGAAASKAPAAKAAGGKRPREGEGAEGRQRRTGQGVEERRARRARRGQRQERGRGRDREGLDAGERRRRQRVRAPRAIRRRATRLRRRDATRAPLTRGGAGPPRRGRRLGGARRAAPGCPSRRLRVTRGGRRRATDRRVTKPAVWVRYGQPAEPGDAQRHRDGGTTAGPCEARRGESGHLARSAVVRREPVSSPRRRQSEKSTASSVPAFDMRCSQPRPSPRSRLSRRRPSRRPAASRPARRS